MSKAHLFKAGDPFTVECARKGAAVGGFKTGCPRTAAIARKGRKASPWNVPLRPQDIRSRRLELLKQAARKTP